MAAGTSAAAAVRESDRISGASNALFELVAGYVLILTVIWTPRPWQARLYVIAAAFVAWSTWRSWPSARAMGLRSTNFLRSSWIIVAAAAVSGVAILSAWHFGTLHSPPTPSLFVGRFLGYTIFACIQQFLLQDFFLWRLIGTGLTPRHAVLAAAGMFSLAHLPNPILTMLTVIWGGVATAWFLRYRSIYSLAVAHIILGISVAICVPGATIHNMRVGLGYVTYDGPHASHPSH